MFETAALPSLAQLITLDGPYGGSYYLVEYYEHLLTELDLSRPHIEALNPAFYIGKKLRVWFLDPRDLEMIPFRHGNPVQNAIGMFEGPYAEMVAAESYSSQKTTAERETVWKFRKPRFDSEFILITLEYHNEY